MRRDVKLQPTPASASGMVRPGTLASENIALARASGQERAFTWEPWSKEVFERARREGKLILLDGAAEWCHWCHVMDETTYADPEVAQLLHQHFVAIRVDVDQRPDVASRYEDWGWPATVLFTPDAVEIGKFRGYMPAEKLRAVLRDALQAASQQVPVGAKGASALTRWPGDPSAPPAALPWIAARVAHDLDRRYDDEQGGWGGPQKAPLSANAEYDILRASHGDAAARERALFTLTQERALIDPVWGGMYQYSVGGTWTNPHYEKLMPIQAAAVEAYARAAQLTGDRSPRRFALRDQGFLRDAARIAGYLDQFLSNDAGAFLVSQDADVGAHDRKARFVDGHVYYSKEDAGRRALGMPRIDAHVYARENGLAIAALAALYEAGHDPAVLKRAERAADLLLRTHVAPDGGVRREAATVQGSETEVPVRYLVDAAALGRGLARLAEVSREGRYREAALRVARHMLRAFADPRSTMLWANTPDAAAVGVFAQRSQPFPHNVLAARFLLAAARLGGDTSLKERARTLLGALSTPSAIDGEGRALGEYLLALAEAGAP